MQVANKVIWVNIVNSYNALNVFVGTSQAAGCVWPHIQHREC